MPCIDHPYRGPLLLDAVLVTLRLADVEKADVHDEVAVEWLQGGVIQHKVKRALPPQLGRLRAIPVPATTQSNK